MKRGAAGLAQRLGPLGMATTLALLLWLSAAGAGFADQPEVQETGEESPEQVATVATHPRILIGMTEEDVGRLLGEPSWTEDTAPSRLWQYASDKCLLRVFFFMEVSTRAYPALSYEITSADDATDVDQQCFADILGRP